MPTDREIYKADLAEFSYYIYSKFLRLVFSNSDIAGRHKILMYCFLNRCISKHQLSILFGNTKLKVKSTYMVVKRLMDNDYLCKYTHGSSSRKEASEAVYLITNSGIKYCKELVASLFPVLMPEETLAYSGHHFTLNEVIDYLSIRCQLKLPAYIEHYLGARDIYTFLLSYPIKNDYSFETEVGISESGLPVSLYTRSLLGINLNSYPVRCDGLLRYRLRGNDEIRWYIELDTGTQRAAVLQNKLNNYIEYVLKSNSFTPLDSIVFSIQTKPGELNNPSDERKKGLGIRDYYYMVILEFAFNLMYTVLPKDTRIRTVGEAIKYLERLHLYGELGPTDIMVYKYFRDADIIDRSAPLEGLKNNYHKYLDLKKERIAESFNERNQKKYVSRRKIIHKCSSSNDELGDYFRRGFSLYTVPNYCIGNTLPFLIPEMFDARDKICKIFSSAGLVGKDSFVGYRPFYKVDDDNFVLRNSYYFKKERLHIIVENITDDFGGLYRIRHLLNYSSIPASLSSSKVICLYDDSSAGLVKETLSSTAMWQQVINMPGSRILDNDIKDSPGSRNLNNDFEILFVSYSSFAAAESLCFNEFIK